MSYSFESRVRFSEIGEDGCLTLPGVLDYFQDCCTFESEQTGVGMEVLKEQKRAWVLSAWQVITKRYPKLGENIKVTTIPYGFRGFIGMRNLFLRQWRVRSWHGPIPTGPLSIQKPVFRKS